MIGCRVDPLTTALPGRGPASRLQALVHMYGHMRAPLRQLPHRGGVRVLIADVRLSSPFVASRRYTPSDVPGVPVAPPIDSTVLQRPPIHRIHPIRSPCAGRRVPRGRPPRRRIKILGLGCSSAIRCSGGAGDRPGVCVDVTRRCTSAGCPWCPSRLAPRSPRGSSGLRPAPYSTPPHRRLLDNLLASLRPCYVPWVSSYGARGR